MRPTATTGLSVRLSVRLSVGRCSSSQPAARLVPRRDRAHWIQSGPAAMCRDLITGVGKDAGMSIGGAGNGCGSPGRRPGRVAAPDSGLWPDYPTPPQVPAEAQFKGCRPDPAPIEGRWLGRPAVQHGVPTYLPTYLGGNCSIGQ